MDLGCIDMGCVENPRKESSSEKENSPKECPASASKLGKNNRAKDAIRSSVTALNRLTSQICKPPHRKTSPLNWFPRKNVEPYLKRKIKMLQEVDGIPSTLDETLGDSHPHYCRVLREKIAIREAAEKAMVAQKAAMVEASWCRILQAARIGSKDAEANLSKVEAHAAEAFAAAREAGVIVNDIPDSGGNHYQTETVPAKGGSMTHHPISATFESAFEVDKQVAAAVKAAFVELASCPPVNKDEFKELLRKISENPDAVENFDLPPDITTTECESDAADPEPEVENADLNSDGARKLMEKQEFDNIVGIMIGRLQCLKEDELASLATIVATCGLNAALSATEISKTPIGVAASANSENPCRRITSARRNTVIARQMSSDAELPSLDKFLVKRLSRLEREVLEAKNARKKELSEDKELLSRKSSRTDKEEREVDCSKQDVPELVEAKSSDNMKHPEGGSVIDSMKTTTLAAKASEEIPFCTDINSVCKENLNGNLSREEIVFGDKNNGKEALSGHGGWVDKDGSYESLDKVLVKHVSRLEKEKQEFQADDRMGAKLKRKDACTEMEISEGSLDQILVKHKSRLEREKMACAGEQQDNCKKKNEKEALAGCGESYESLDKVLVKHVSRLEKEKQRFHGEDRMPVKLKRKDPFTESEKSLDQILVQHKSRLEREKMSGVVLEQDNNNSIPHSVSRREAREKELQATWGGMSLGNSMRPHVSRLQRDKAAWIEAEAAEMKKTLEE